MCSGIYQTFKDEIENTRLILQLSNERSNQLVNINNQSVGIIAAICIGLISFLGTAYFTSNDPNRFYVIIIAIQIMCFTLIIWRFYAHIIDNEIVQIYKRILECEIKLNIFPAFSLLNSLEDSINIRDNPRYSNQSLEVKYKIILKLIDRNRIGYRLHDKLDYLGIGLIGIALVIQFAIFYKAGTPLGVYEYCTFLIFIPILYCIVFFGFTQDSYFIIPIQQDPSNEELDSVFSEIGLST